MPYLAYLSSNALFPVMTFLVLLKTRENINLLPVYMVGKVIAVVLFYVWAFLSFPYTMEFMGRNQFLEAMILLGSAFFISIGDALSVLGAWTLQKKISRSSTEHGTNGGV